MAVRRVAQRSWAMRIGLWLVPVAGGLAAIAHLASALSILMGRYLFALGGADPYLPVSELPQLLQADLRPGVTFTVADLPVGLRVLCASPAVVAALTMALAVVLLVGVLDRIADGNAFGRPVQRGLTVLSLVLVLGGLLQGLLDTAAIVALVAGLDPALVEGIGTSMPDWPWTLIVVGVAVSALTVAFAEGARLQQDVAGVI